MIARAYTTRGDGLRGKSGLGKAGPGYDPDAADERCGERRNRLWIGRRLRGKYHEIIRLFTYDARGQTAK